MSIEYLVQGGGDHCSEGGKYYPYGWRDQHQASKVDIVVNGIKDGGKEELKRVPKGNRIHVRDLAFHPDNGGPQLDNLHQDY